MTAATLALMVSLWAAPPVGAGDPLGQITEFTTGLTPNNGPNRIAAGPDGNLWFTERANPARIGRITPTGNINEFMTTLTPNSEPGETTAGPGGNRLVDEINHAGSVGQ